MSDIIEEWHKTYGNEDISLLALKAAREIDLARRGKNYDSRSVQTLINHLMKDDSADSSVEIMKRMGPADTEVMAGALSAYGGEKVKSLEELAAYFDKMLGEFSRPLTELDGEHLEKLVVFCLTLHDELLSERGSNQEPRSEYRV